MKRILVVFMIFIVSQRMHAEAEYLFEQQYDDGCRVLPLLNLHKLERLSKKYGAQNLIDQTPWHEWNSRRESLGTFFPFYYEWVNAFNILSSNPNTYPHLHAFLVGMAADGPVFPHFYDKDGAIPTDISPDENGNEQVHMKYQINTFPFSLFDYGTMFYPDEKLKNDLSNIQYYSIEELQYESPILKTLLPFGKNKDTKENKEKNITAKKGDYVLYNSVTHAYDVVNVQNLLQLKDAEPCGNQYSIDILKNVILPQSTDLFVWQYKKYSKLNELGALFMGQLFYKDSDGNCKIDEPLGFAEICYIKKLPLEIKVSTGTAYGSGLDIFGTKTGMTSFGPGDIGRTKLMFLRLGIDENNQDITSKHSLYGAYQDFKNLCNSSKDNPWNDSYCKKENFLQYHIAAVLKNNPELREQLESVFNALEIMTTPTFQKNIWESYTLFLQDVENGQLYRDRNGTAYDSKKMAPYMLGKEQMLAYLTASVVRMLWYGAIDESAFKERTGFDSFSEYQNLVQKKVEIKNKNVSFIDVWHAVTKNLSGKNFFSLEFHGWLISFDANIIALQKNMPDFKNGKTVDLIGCIGIESIFSSEFKNAFYRRERVVDAKNKVLRNEYARIAMVEELSRQLIAVGTFKISEISGLSELKKANSEGKVLSIDQLEKLKKMEKNLEPYKKEAEKIQSEVTTKIQKAFKEKKEMEKSVDIFSLALKNL